MEHTELYLSSFMTTGLTSNTKNIAESFLKATMTIPDLYDYVTSTIRRWWKRTIDIPLSLIESVGSRMNVYAWNKRWGNREKGTGYRNEVE